MTTMAAEIRNMFFKPGLTGSIFGSAPPIWQELDFESCTDGSIRRVSASPLLRSSYMPNQYLYRDGKAINLDGAYTHSSNPVTTGDFYHFSGTSTPPDRENPYTECARESGHAGNPWSITPVHRCGDEAVIRPPLIAKPRAELGPGDRGPWLPIPPGRRPSR
ncbi:hypothetical protein [Streptomyces sp. NPDC015125]|uniref:hypothetical protein n=1 Tax=Streptomyces sp. NPDC015125 TaxID=3364938 RepID=UPI0036F7C41B